MTVCVGPLHRACRRGHYVCEYCGQQGNDPRPVDQVQCPVCGEPVTPTSSR